jgi:hypothetical protein
MIYDIGLKQLLTLFVSSLTSTNGGITVNAPEKSQPRDELRPIKNGSDALAYNPLL